MRKESITERVKPSSDRDRLEQEKERLRLKERMIKIREKKRMAREFVNIGRLAHQAKIDHLDATLLLGAFIDVAGKANDKDVQHVWKELAAAHMKNRLKNEDVPLCVTFAEDPKKETKDALKELGFQWNRFRREWAGYGQKDALEKLLDGMQVTIEVL